MENGNPAVIALADREGRRGDGPRDAQRPARTPDQSRLPRTEVAADDDDVAAIQASGDLRAGGLRLGGGGRVPLLRLRVLH